MVGDPAYSGSWQLTYSVDYEFDGQVVTLPDLALDFDVIAQPDPPQGLLQTAVENYTTTRVEWTEPENASSVADLEYDVYIDGSYETSTATTYYEFSNGGSSFGSLIEVRCTGSGLESTPNSAELTVSLLPDIPTNLAQVAILSETTLRLEWGLPTNAGEFTTLDYIIYKDSVEVGTISDLYYEFEQDNEGEQYIMKVHCVSETGTGHYAELTVYSTIPEPPQNLAQVELASGTTLRIEWEPPTNAADFASLSYVIQKDDVEIDTTSDQYYEFEQDNPGEQYTMKIYCASSPEGTGFYTELIVFSNGCFHSIQLFEDGVLQSSYEAESNSNEFTLANANQYIDLSTNGCTVTSSAILDGLLTFSNQQLSLTGTAPSNINPALADATNFLSLVHTEEVSTLQGKAELIYTTDTGINETVELIFSFEFSCQPADKPFDAMATPQTFEWPLTYDLVVPVTRQNDWTDICGGEATISLDTAWPFLSVVGGALNEDIPTLEQLLTGVPPSLPVTGTSDYFEFEVGITRTAEYWTDSTTTLLQFYIDCANNKEWTVLYDTADFTMAVAESTSASISLELYQIGQSDDWTGICPLADFSLSYTRDSVPDPASFITMVDLILTLDPMASTDEGTYILIPYLNGSQYKDGSSILYESITIAVTPFDCEAATLIPTADISDALSLSAFETAIYEIQNSIDSPYTECALYCIEIDGGPLTDYISFDNSLSPAAVTFDLANIKQAHIGSSSIQITFKTSDCADILSDDLGDPYIVTKPIAVGIDCQDIAWDVIDNFSAPIYETTPVLLPVDKIADADGVSFSDANGSWAGCGQADISLAGDATAFTTYSGNILFDPIDSHEGNTYSFQQIYTSQTGDTLTYGSIVEVTAINCANQELELTEWVAGSDTIDATIGVPQILTINNQIVSAPSMCPPYWISVVEQDWFVLDQSGSPGTFTIDTDQVAFLGAQIVNFAFFEDNTETIQAIQNSDGESYAATDTAFNIVLDCALIAWSEEPSETYQVNNYEASSITISSEHVLDPDGADQGCGTASVALVTGMAFVTLTVNANSYTLDFTPNDDAHEGVDTFSVIYTDDDGNESTFAVELTVDGVVCDNFDMQMTDWVAEASAIEVAIDEIQVLEVLTMVDLLDPTVCPYFCIYGIPLPSFMTIETADTDVSPSLITLAPTLVSEVGDIGVSFIISKYDDPNCDMSQILTQNSEGDNYATGVKTFTVTIDCQSKDWQFADTSYTVHNYETTEFLLINELELDDESVSWSEVCGTADITTPNLSFGEITTDGSDFTLVFNPYDANLETDLQYIDLVFTDQDGVETTYNIEVTVHPPDCSNDVHEMIVTDWIAGSDIVVVDVFESPPVLDILNGIVASPADCDYYCVSTVETLEDWMTLETLQHPATFTMDPSVSGHVADYTLNFLFYEYSDGCTDTSNPVATNLSGEQYATETTITVTLSCQTVDWDEPTDSYEVYNFEDTRFNLSADKVLDDDGVTWSSVCGQATITISDTTFARITGTGSNQKLLFTPYDLTYEDTHSFDLIYTDIDGVEVIYPITVLVNPIECSHHWLDNPGYNDQRPWVGQTTTINIQIGIADWPDLCDLYCVDLTMGPISYVYIEYDESANPHFLTITPQYANDVYEITVDLTFYDNDGTCAVPYLDESGQSIDTSFTILPKVNCADYNWLRLADSSMEVTTAESWSRALATDKVEDGAGKSWSRTDQCGRAVISVAGAPDFVTLVANVLTIAPTDKGQVGTYYFNLLYDSPADQDIVEETQVYAKVVVVHDVCDYLDWQEQDEQDDGSPFKLQLNQPQERFQLLNDKQAQPHYQCDQTDFVLLTTDFDFIEIENGNYLSIDATQASVQDYTITIQTTREPITAQELSIEISECQVNKIISDSSSTIQRLTYPANSSVEIDLPLFLLTPAYCRNELEYRMNGVTPQMYFDQGSHKLIAHFSGAATYFIQLEAISHNVDGIITGRVTYIIDVTAEEFLPEAEQITPDEQPLTPQPMTFAPTPMTHKGEFSIKLSSAIKKVDWQTFQQQSTLIREIWLESLEPEVKPNIEVGCRMGQDSLVDGCNCAYVEQTERRRLQSTDILWEVELNEEGTDLEFKIDFQDPLSLSQGDSPDYLQIILWGAPELETINGEVAYSDPQFNVVRITPQLYSDDLQEVQQTFIQVLEVFCWVLIVSLLIIKMFIKGSLKKLFRLVEFVQLFAYLPLVDIKFPANALMLYQQLVQISKFEFLPTDNTNSPLNDQFQDLNIYSPTFIRNIGSIFYLANILVGLYLLYILSLGFEQVLCRRINKKLDEELFWNNSIIFLEVFYLPVCLGICINFYQGVDIETVSNLYLIPFTVICAGYPVCLVYLEINGYSSRFSVIKDQNIWMALQKVALVVILVFGQLYPYFQIPSLFLLNFISILVLRNKRELLLLLFTYFLISLALAPSPQTRHLIGTCLFFFTALIMTFLVISLIRSTLVHIERYSKYEKYREKLNKKKEKKEENETTTLDTVQSIPAEPVESAQTYQSNMPLNHEQIDEGEDADGEETEVKMVSHKDEKVPNWPIQKDLKSMIKVKTKQTSSKLPPQIAPSPTISALKNLSLIEEEQVEYTPYDVLSQEENSRNKFKRTPVNNLLAMGFEFDQESEQNDGYRTTFSDLPQFGIENDDYDIRKKFERNLKKRIAEGNN